MPPRDPLLDPVSVDRAVREGETVSLDAAAAAGLRARQVNPKEAFTLLDAAGRWFRASLATLDGSGATALVYESMATSPESDARVTLYCAVLQRQRMLFVCQKATELGVARIVPVFTERSVQADGLHHEKWHAWPGQVLKGARQCRRGSLPELTKPVALSRAITERAWVDADARFVMDDRRPSGAVRDALTRRGPVDLALLVGPEGGFDAKERDALDAAGALPLRLGGRVLRSETAVVAGLTALQVLLGDMGAA